MTCERVPIKPISRGKEKGRKKKVDTELESSIEAKRCVIEIHSDDSTEISCDLWVDRAEEGWGAHTARRHRGGAAPRGQDDWWRNAHPADEWWKNVNPKSTTYSISEPKIPLSPSSLPTSRPHLLSRSTPPRNKKMILLSRLVSSPPSPPGPSIHAQSSLAPAFPSQATSLNSSVFSNHRLHHLHPLLLLLRRRCLHLWPRLDLRLSSIILGLICRS